MMSQMTGRLIGALIFVFALAGAAGASDEKPAPLSVPVDTASMIMLVQTSILALNQANLTNDYSVLYELAGPGFQQKNKPEDLAKIFANQREAGHDLSPVVLHTPQFTRPPMIQNGLLRLTGLFKTQPLQVHFDLLFEPVGNQWKLFGISVALKQG